MHRLPATPSARAALATLLLTLAAAAAPDRAAEAIVVNDPGDGADAAADGSCDTDPGTATTCTLRAALQELNADVQGGTVTFDPSLEGATVTVGATATSRPIADPTSASSATAISACSRAPPSRRLSARCPSSR